MRGFSSGPRDLNDPFGQLEDPEDAESYEAIDGVRSLDSVPHAYRLPPKGWDESGDGRGWSRSDGERFWDEMLGRWRGGQ